jgi:hypothetical protein
MSAMIKMLFQKRNADIAHRQEASAFADRVSDVIKSHIENTSSDTKLAAVTVGLVMMFLFDGTLSLEPADGRTGS